MPLKKTTKVVPKVDGKLNVLFVGDSQTDYSTSYANLLLGNEVTGKRISKIGAAMSTITEYFEEGYVKGEFDIVSVMGGNNDATNKKFNKSFADIVKKVTADGGKVVIITCPSVKYVNKGTKSNGKPYWPYFAKSKKSSTDYYSAAADIAKWQSGLATDNVIIVDAHNKLDDKKYFDIDGLHYSSNGQKELKKLWLDATKSINSTATVVEKEDTSKQNSQQPVDITPVTEQITDEEEEQYAEYLNKDYQPDIQSDFNFDVTKSKTFIISNPPPDSNLVTLNDGSKVNLGELTIVKQENPEDPEIIRLLTPYLQSNEKELDPEYIEEPYVGEEEEQTFIFMTDPPEADPPEAVIGLNSEGNEVKEEYKVSDPNVKEVDLESMFLYMTHNQGAFGAKCHYEVATGKKSKYPVSKKMGKKQWVANMVLNWPKDKSNAIQSSEVSGLFDTNPKKLAAEYLLIWKRGYAKKQEAANKLINSGGKNRTGVKYSDILAIFKKNEDKKDLPWQRLLEFAYIENSFCTDTANEKLVDGVWTTNSFKTIFQIHSRYYGPKAGKLDVLSKIKTTYLYKDAYGIKGKRYWNDYDLDDCCKHVVPRIISNFKSFKNSCDFDLKELNKIGL